jgi:MFS transporter, ACS family, tartrate transporter
MAQILDEQALEQSVMSKIMRRPMAVLFFVYILNFLDRTNIGIAKIRMATDMGLGETAYGLGAGLFFIGYILFEIPSNLILFKVGARFWITRIMVTWGIVSAAMAFVESERWFYILRFLLGVAETGLVPGVMLYLSLWIPNANRAKITALFYLAVPVSTIIGAPISSYLLDMNVFGMVGWRFMFLAEGLPSVLFAIVVWMTLTDKPEEAHWLTDSERNWLTGKLKQEKALQESNQHATSTTLGALRDPLILGLSVCYFSMVIPLYALSFFLPTIVQQMGAGSFSTLTIGFLTAIPYLFASVGLLLISRNSDSTNERTFHYAIPALVGAIALVIAGLTFSTFPMIALIGVGIGAIGCISTLPPLWAQTPKILKGVAVAGGIAIINSVGNIAGFASPYLIGLLRDSATTPESSTLITMCTVAGFLALAGIVMIMVGRGIKTRTAII